MYTPINNVILLPETDLVRLAISHVMSLHLNEITLEEINEDELSDRLNQNPESMIIIETTRNADPRFELINNIREHYPLSKILVVSSQDSYLFAIPYLRTGVIGFFSTRTSIEDFIFAIDTILSGKKYIDNGLWEVLISHLIGHKKYTEILTFTQKEQQILDQILKGKSAREIANNSSLNVKTIYAIRRRLYRKTNATNLSELVNFVQHYRRSVEAKKTVLK